MSRYLGAKIEGTLYASAADAGEISENRDVMDKAFALGRQLAEINNK
jgi:hypothetical protein